MSIKGAIKRLENVVAKNSGTPSIIFIIPYCRDPGQSKQIKSQLINENGLSNKSDVLIIFVIDFAMAA